jgi:ATP-dependent DNA ligase
VCLCSRNDNDFSLRYPAVVEGLAGLPDETVINGEVVAFDEDGRPRLTCSRTTVRLLPRSCSTRIMVLRGKDVMSETLEKRQRLLEQIVLPELREPVRYVAPLNAALPDLVASVKAHGLEGLVAKRLGSRYESGIRSGAWMKMRVNRGQEFVIGGYTLGTKTFDALIFGYYEGKTLMYAARTRNGFTPATRLALFKKFAGLEVQDCPFAQRVADGGRDSLGPRWRNVAGSNLCWLLRASFSNGPATVTCVIHDLSGSAKTSARRT